MAAVTAGMVAQLRERTGLGMMECKKALTENDGDLEAAIDFLRKKGAKTKEGRIASEGLVVAQVSADGKTGALVEVNSETDFVARNDDFRALAQALAQKAANSSANTVEELLAEAHEDADLADKTVGGAINAAINRIGEKIVLGRFVRFHAGENGFITTYIHSTSANSIEGGKIGVMVETTPSDSAQLGREVAMHISFAKPLFLTEADIDPAVLAKEREIITAQAEQDPKMTGKPEAAINAMIEGRVRKYKGEVVLMDQPYIRDDKKTVAKLVQETAGASVVRFARFEIGASAPKAEA